MPEQPPSSLWEKIKEQTERALKNGALQPIPTEYEFIEQDGIRFLVRVLSNLVRKDEAKKQERSTKKDFNPFLPYDEKLFVTDISDTHLCLLNKYNVVEYHILIVTRAFEEQESLLTQEDFAAMWACLGQIDGLVFYNAGKAAGASQRHKHLQLIALPLLPEEVNLPIEPLLAEASFSHGVGTIPTLPFKHAFVKFDSQTAEATKDCYSTLLRKLDLQGKEFCPYNLLATREWMLIVPRSQECFESISVNSLGFAGALLVRDRQQLQRLKDYRPMTILKSVAR